MLVVLSIGIGMGIETRDDVTVDGMPVVALIDIVSNESAAESRLWFPCMSEMSATIKQEWVS